MHRGMGQVLPLEDVWAEEKAVLLSEEARGAGEEYLEALSLDDRSVDSPWVSSYVCTTFRFRSTVRSTIFADLPAFSKLLANAYSYWVSRSGCLQLFQGQGEETQDSCVISAIENNFCKTKMFVILFYS